MDDMVLKSKEAGDGRVLANFLKGRSENHQAVSIFATQGILWPNRIEAMGGGQTQV